MIFSIRPCSAAIRRSAFRDSSRRIVPAATKDELAEFRTRIIASPAKYIAQPTLSLSSCPTFVESGLAPRHIDFRPYVLSGRQIHIAPGGLTRVALREGSLVVNS